MNETELVYRINNTRLAFQTSKTTIYRPHTPELKSTSKCGRTLKNIWSFTLLFNLEAGETELITYEIRVLYYSW